MLAANIVVETPGVTKKLFKVCGLVALVRNIMDISENLSNLSNDDEHNSARNM